MILPRRLTSAGALVVVLAAAGATPTASAHEREQTAAPAAPPTAKPELVHHQLAMPDGRTADVYSNGLAILADPVSGRTETRMLPAYDLRREPSGLSLAVGKDQVVVDLAKGTPALYRADRVRVVLSDSVHATRPVTSVAPSTLDRVGRLHGASLAKAAPDYTSSPTLNGTLAHLGARRVARQFHDLPAAATAAARSAPLDLTNAYVVDLAGSDAARAVEELLASPDVAYAAPAWTVTSMNLRPTVIADKAVTAARATARRIGSAATSRSETPTLPTNYALTTSMQSLLNRPGINWTEAYQVLQQRYGQLPGEGQIITNVSIGDLTDGGLPATHPCASTMSSAGPTTVVRDGQRYLDLPSLPLIPAYTASADGTLDPTGATCGQDLLDGEIDLDFAMMAGLPHDRQRSGAEGAGYTDLLGVAPGADYRLVVPATTDGVDIVDIDAALLAAAQQTPRPDVITASLGFGFDTQGFPSRYLEDDQFTQALVSFIVSYYHVVVCISSGDGLRQYTNAAYGPSGGSAATNVAGRGEAPTDVDDVQASDTPSLVRDSGAIDVGGTTLDDIFSAPPQDPRNRALAHQHAFPIVRSNGTLSFSSGFGSRVNVSAPGDNVVAFQHHRGGDANAVDSVLTGGTSASAPIVAAAAAVVRQTAELVGDRHLASDPRAVRSWLQATAEPVPNVPQADQTIQVGPQVDLGEAVARLVTAHTRHPVDPGVARVAVEQRRQIDLYDAVFLGDTDPDLISLADNDQIAWITIAPDWVGSAADGQTRYALTVGNTTLATTPYARLSPRRLFAAAGKAWPPSTATPITLTYTARVPHHAPVRTDVVLGFQAVSGGIIPLAPTVPPVATGDSIPVSYDLSDLNNISEPVLVVSEPGRTGLWDKGWRIAYQQVLHDDQGTVRVPVSALHGGGIYGISIQAGLQISEFTNWAFTRVRAARSDVRPPAPTLAAAGGTPGHFLEIRFAQQVTVHWDVRSVPQASGARLEVSAPGPNIAHSLSTFNNPNGTVRDDNGLDTGSVHEQALPGTHGDITLSAEDLGLVGGTYQQVRVRPVDSRGRAAGEASGYSTAHTLGVTGPGGQSVVQIGGMGFGVDQHGPTGLLASGGGLLGAGPAAVTQFDQATGAAVRSLAAADGGHALAVLNMAGPGVFTGHMGLYQDFVLADRTVTFRSVDLDTGVQRAWRPPDGYLPPHIESDGSQQVLAADNQTAPATAFVAGTNGGDGGDWTVFTSDIAAGTFGPAHSLADAVGALRRPILGGIAQDPTTNTAYVAVRSVPAPALVAVDLRTGSTRTMPLPRDCQAMEVAVNTAAHTALLGGVRSMCLVDLATGKVTVKDDGGVLHNWIVADNTRGVFLVFEYAGVELARLPNPHAPGNLWTQTGDSNVTSRVLVLDAQGRLLRRVASLNSNGVVFRAGGSFVQANPSTGVGYALAPDGVSLQPFGYVG